MKRALAITALLIFAGVAQSNATQLVRELWDRVAPTSGAQLKGLTNGTSSLGFFPNAGIKWVINPADSAATNVLLVDTNDDVADFMLSVAGAYLPPSATVPGTLALAANNTNGANGGWDSGIWATRLLAGSSAINFSSNSTNYFSARLIKRGTWWLSGVNGTNNYGNDDAALGFGFANGNASGSRFVGAGFTRSVANKSGGAGYIAADGITQIGDSVYVTSGTLGQAGLAGHPADSGGPYLVRAYGFQQEVEGWIGAAPYVNGGLLVGRLITTTSGNSELDVRAYVAADNIDPDPNLVTWDVIYTFNETVTMNSLLVWMYGNNNANPCWLDAIRVATTWPEIMGEEVVGPPVASPTNAVYPGTPVTFSVVANVDPANAWYQWMTNGIPDTNAVGIGVSTYTITNPVTANSGMTLSVVFSNTFLNALAITSSVQTLTVLPPVPPILTTAPKSGNRYLGAPSFTFSVVADGARPFTYQWKQIAGGTTNVLTGQTNASLTFTNIQTTNAGSFFVTVANTFGPTNAPPVALSVIIPGGYAAAIVTNGPYAYWPMNETNGTVFHDYWGGQDGSVIDTNYTVTNIVISSYVTNNSIVTTNYATNTFGAGVSLGVAGAVGPGFPSPHYGVFIPNNSYLARVNMPALPAYTNVMTFCSWIYTPGAPNATGIIFNRDLNSNGGYANAFGLEFTGYVPSPGVTNYNQLGYQWGGGTENPTAPWLGYTWSSSGLYVPQASWTFVALVISNTQATLYMGTNNSPLTVASATLPASLDSTFPGTVYTNGFPLLMGRGGYPWAEGQSNAWNNVSMQMSDVAVFYSALPPTNIYKLYLAAVGELITTTNASGNTVLKWPAGVLQAAGQVTGAYTNVPGATSPYTVPNNVPQMFYRVLSQ